ncbi:metallophosphoesterase family protein [uncultured Thermanaerothrix sp.]|uniref:metallophosphoesterase family protein n=1 Tax=uncultured Thermanaerothrix sp. TaxID=1195149 RepID=UPI00260789AC|nr:metallophosphoesterase family protein [uncultured Thermanaerothrix sp.]
MEGQILQPIGPWTPPLEFSTRLPLTIAIVADTHVPDRFKHLHPQLLSTLRRHNPDLILHAGDICAPKVLRTLATLAPVVAVRGNRDWAFQNILPWKRDFTLGGVMITLTHGHGSWRTYLLDKWQYLFNGYQPERYRRRLLALAPTARVIIFGHTHRPIVEWYQERLFLNPGSASAGVKPNDLPSFGVLRIQSPEQVSASIYPLPPFPRWGASSDT